MTKALQFRLKSPLKRVVSDWDILSLIYIVLYVVPSPRGSGQDGKPDATGRASGVSVM